MDNTHTILKKEHAQAFIEQMNMVDDDVKWTMEGDIEVVTEIRVDTQEEVGFWIERALAFLDTMSVINIDDLIQTCVLERDTYGPVPQL